MKSANIEESSYLPTFVPVPEDNNEKKAKILKKVRFHDDQNSPAKNLSLEAIASTIGRKRPAPEQSEDSDVVYPRRNGSKRLCRRLDD